MPSLFRSFERFGVDYLLIRGQACVLYGASLFSEDIDVWVEPSRANIRRMLRALASMNARVYKLTPPIEKRWLLRGHGFHFRIPTPSRLPIFLDVMGRPPRVGSFATARRRSSSLAGPDGRVPTIAIEDLVEVKKTRRPADYDAITNLVEIRIGDAKRPSLLRWGAKNAFRAEVRMDLLGRLGKRSTLSFCVAQVARDMARLQHRDIRYWSSRIEELRTLRRSGLLLPLDLAVRSLV